MKLSRIDKNFVFCSKASVCVFLSIFLLCRFLRMCNVKLVEDVCEMLGAGFIWVKLLVLTLANVQKHEITGKEDATTCISYLQLYATLDWQDMSMLMQHATSYC